MQKFKQGKKLIISLLCLMLIALAAFSCAYLFFEKRKNNTFNMLEAGYVDLDTALSTNPSPSYEYVYNYSDIFWVSNKAGLNLLASMVNSGYSFNGKKIYLQATIDYKNAEWTPIGNKKNPFKGWFYGNGNTIKNLKISKSMDYAGFFGFMDGDAFVYNLDIENFQITADKISNVGAIAGRGTGYYCDLSVFNMSVSIGSGLCIGGLVGSVADIIMETCEINKFQLRTIFGHGHYGVGGLIGATGDNSNGDYEIDIDNCAVRNMTMEGSYTTCCGGVAGFVGYANYAKNVYINDCAFVNLSIKDDTYIGSPTSGFFALVGSLLNSPENIYAYDCLILNFYDCNQFAHVSSYGGGKNCVLVDIFCNMKTLSETLGHNDVKKAAVDYFSSNRLWYVPPSDVFNDGWPYLNSFVEETEYSFEAGEHGTVQLSTGDDFIWLVSKDVDNSNITFSDLENISGSSKTTHTFLGVSIEATADEGYTFANWSREGNTFVANFQIEGYFLTIRVVDEQGVLLRDEWFTSVEFNQKFTGFQCEIEYGESYWSVGDLNFANNIPLKYTFDNAKIKGTTFGIEDTIVIPDLGDHASRGHVMIFTFKLKSYDIEVS